MNRIIFISICFLFGSAMISLQAQTRLLNKIKEKAEDKLIEQIFDEDTKSEKTNQSQSKQNSSSNNSNSGSNKQNTKGGGLSSTDYDIPKLIGDAEKSVDNEEYSNARFSIRQAIQGIELEIGKEVLNDLPPSINGLDANFENDQVVSTGIGFAGMMIQRDYEKSDMSFNVIVANNSVWISSVSMYLSNPAYANSSDQQYKQITFQGNKAIIEYDDDSGYKLSVPFGQTSILVISGINFDNENEFMNACNKVSVDNIKSKLGEQ